MPTLHVWIACRQFPKSLSCGSYCNHMLELYLLIIYANTTHTLSQGLWFSKTRPWPTTSLLSAGYQAAKTLSDKSRHYITTPPNLPPSPASTRNKHKARWPDLRNDSVFKYAISSSSCLIISVVHKSRISPTLLPFLNPHTSVKHFCVGHTQQTKKKIYALLDL